MSGLLALLDDVAAIAKMAAASVDDVVGQAAKAGAKAAGAAIDDAAVTPTYVDGFEADRELPIVWRIAKGSIRNKLLILLPVGLLLSTFAPALINPLLMLGGAYLCFEGAEKIFHLVFPHGDATANYQPPTSDTENRVEEQTAHQQERHLEEKRIEGAIKTDFILSAEIMTIALGALGPGTIWMQAATLAVVAIGITAVVYGGVAIIVKADDVGLFASQHARLAPTRALGRAVVRGMPTFLKVLVAVGTVAMLWVGGSIIIHGLETMGLTAPGHLIANCAEIVAGLLPNSVSGLTGVVHWLTTATLQAVFGLVLGLLLIPLVTFILAPLAKSLIFKKTAEPRDE